MTQIRVAILRKLVRRFPYCPCSHCVCSQERVNGGKLNFLPPPQSCQEKTTGQWKQQPSVEKKSMKLTVLFLTSERQMDRSDSRWVTKLHFKHFGVSQHLSILTIFYYEFCLICIVWSMTVLYFIIVLLLALHWKRQQYAVQCYVPIVTTCPGVFQHSLPMSRWPLLVNTNSPLSTITKHLSELRLNLHILWKLISSGSYMSLVTYWVSLQMILGRQVLISFRYNCPRILIFLRYWSMMMG